MMSKSPNILVQENLDLLEKVVSVMKKRFGSFASRDDIKSYAMEGLALAIEKFDDSRDVPLSVYARKHMYWSVYDGFTSSGWFSRRMERQIAFYKNAEVLLDSKNNNPPPLDYRQAVHSVADSLKELATAYVTTSVALENKPQTGIGAADAEEYLIKKDYRQKIIEVIEKLPERKKKLIYMRFFDDLSIDEIARKLKMSKSWASRSLSSAIVNLKDTFEKEKFNFDDD